jgi:hypothetical protein
MRSLQRTSSKKRVSINACAVNLRQITHEASFRAAVAHRRYLYDTAEVARSLKRRGCSFDKEAAEADRLSQAWVTSSIARCWLPTLKSSQALNGILVMSEAYRTRFAGSTRHWKLVLSVTPT